MDLYPFGTNLLHQDLATNFLLECAGNLPTQPSTSIQIVTTTFLPNTVCKSPLHTEQGLCQPTAASKQSKEN